jgi:hypothetical protein
MILHVSDIHSYVAASSKILLKAEILEELEEDIQRQTFHVSFTEAAEYTRAVTL